MPGKREEFKRGAARSSTEIAARLGISSAAVGQIEKRALAKLRARMNRDDFVEENTTTRRAR
jgi:DNA-directed RNA polymerase specialized sigma24 family protein